MDWQAITHDAMRSVFSQVNNNLAQQNMVASGMQATNPGFADGGAPRHIQGLIPGKVNPDVADDTVIKAKRGEYIFPVEVVEALGGPEVLDGIVLGVKNKLGLPAVVGPAVGGVDSQGRPDAKGLQPSTIGAADGGAWGVAKDIGNGLYGASQKIPGVSDAASAVKSAAEFGFSPMTAIPRSAAGAVSNLLDGRPPDGMLGSAFMYMTEAGKNTDATQTGPSSFGSAFPQPVKPSAEPLVPGGNPSSPASTTAAKPKGLPSPSITTAPAEAPAFNTPLLQVGGSGGQAPVSISTGNIKGLAEQDMQRGVLSDGVRHNNSYDLARGVQSIMNTASGNDITQSKGISPTVIIRGPLDAATAKSIRDRVDWSNGSVNANAVRNSIDKYGRTYDEQVAHAQQVNAANALPTLSPKQAAELAIANDPRRSAVTRANAAQGVAQFNNQMENAKTLLGNQQAQTIAGLKEQGDKYVADKTVESHKYTADKNLAAHKYAADAGVAKATQTALGKRQEQEQKEYVDRVKGLVTGWEKLNIPASVAPKLNYYANLHAQAEDPKGNIFMLPPNRQGGQYAALPKKYESHYQKLLQSMSHNDAAARVYAVAKQNGHAIDVPDFNRFQTRKEAAAEG